MKIDKSLLDEMERSRRLIKDSGLDERVRQLHNPAIQHAIESVRNASAMPAVFAAAEMVRMQNLDWMAAFQQPLLDSLQRMATDSSAHQLSQIAKIQSDLVAHSVASLNLSGFNNTKFLGEHFRALDSLRFDHLLKPTREIEAMLNATRSIVESAQIKSLAGFAQHGFEAMLRNYPAESMLAAFQTSEFIRQNLHLSNFPASFAAELLAKLPYREDEDYEELDYEDFQERILEFFEFFVQKIRHLDKGWINSMAIVSFIFLFLVPIYQVYEGKQAEIRSSQEAEARQNELSVAIENSRLELVKEIERLMPAAPESTFYVVERVAQLKSATKTSSASIAILPPNQMVELHSRKGRWIYVEYFDYIDGIPKTGWVLKKYLKMVAK